MSPRQQQALDCWLKDYSMPEPLAPWCLSTAFGREAQTVVEIGFGMGASLSMMAQQRPDVNFLGIEVHRAGIGSLAADLHDVGLTNVRIGPYDAVEVFKRGLVDNALAGVQIFFPDPWPKLRHHKRRLIQTEFIDLLLKKVRPGGFIHCATDWEDYAHHMQAVLSQHPGLLNQNSQGGFSPRPDTRPITKFEQRGTCLGHGVWDLIYLKR